MKKIILSATLLLFSTLTHAIDLEYKGFYQRLKLIEENNLNAINMAFYLVDSYHRTRCELTKATMLSKGKADIDIKLGFEGQLLVHFSETLYDNFALLRVTQKDERQHCVLQMQMQVKDKSKRQFNYTELALVTSQMQALVDEFGGLLSFMMPDVHGLSIVLVNATDIEYINQDLQSDLTCELKKCQLKINQEQQNSETAIVFKHAPMVISPWILAD